MNRKIINYVFILLVAFFGVFQNVRASITLDYEANSDNKETLLGSSYDSTFDDTSLFPKNSEGSGPKTHYRISTNNKNVFCADASLGSPAATGSITFSDCSSYTSSTKALTYILENSFPTKNLGSTKFEGYFITQMAIWYYTNNNHVWLSPYKNGNWQNGGPVVKKIGNLIEEANIAATATPTLTATVTSNDMKLTTDRAYYISNPILLKGTYLKGQITVATNNASAFVTSTETATSGTTTFDNESTVYVKIPASAVTDSLDIKLTLSATTYLGNGSFTLCKNTNPDLQGLLEYTQGSSNLNKELTLNAEKDKTTIAISKQASTGNMELPGASLKITDSLGNSIPCTIQRFEGGTSTKNDLAECAWTSGNAPAVIIGLEPGTYYLEETLAPSGYVLNTEKIEFEIKENEDNEPIKMRNALNKVEIYKITAENKKPLSGASLEIQDENGNVVEYCLDEDNGIIACKWVSTEEPYEIEGMPNGTYYLVETAAPEGYTLNSKKKEFIVDGSAAIVKVEMENEVEIPDTLSAKSALLFLVAMFDIALGIGIITYVKKNKVTE